MEIEQNLEKQPLKMEDLQKNCIGQCCFHFGGWKVFGVCDYECGTGRK